MEHKKKIVSLIALFVGVFLLSGCGPKCPECPKPSSYSECSDEGVRTRTNYKCSEASNFQCESYLEETQCKTELRLEGSVGNISATIKPTLENKVKGTIQVEVDSVPEGTSIVAFYFEGGSLSPIGSGRMPSFATKQNGVWAGVIDTTEYENGLYTLGIVSSNKESMDGPPQAYASAQLLISN